MAVIGHWIASFLLAYWLPEASITLLTKLSMFSDMLAGIFLLFKIERGGIYAKWFMSTPPPGTVALIQEWQNRSEWEVGVDLHPGEAQFSGFGALFPFYIDVSYSHSVELMMIMAVLLAAFMVVRFKIGAAYACAIVLATISHPLLDIIFHDAHIFMGDRTKSKYSLGLWQHDELIIPALLLELLMAYLPYRLWLSSKEPVDAEPQTLESIARYKKMFWFVALNHNQASFYLMSPVLEFLLYRYTSLNFGADNEWSYIIVCLTMMSWSGALYPLYRLDALLRTKGAQADDYKSMDKAMV